MIPNRIYLIVCFLLVVYCSCNQQEKRTITNLEKAEQLMDVYPDSALTVLDSVVGLEALDRDIYHKYYLLRIQAKEKLAKNISKDTTIFGAKKYFLEKRDFENAALASFYSGRVLQENGDKEKATLAYLDAEEYSKESTNYNLKGLIQSLFGELNYKPAFREIAIEKYKQANHYFKLAGKYKNEISTYNMIGNNFLLNGQSDSAFYYYQRGLDLTEIHNDTTEKANFMNNIGMALWVTKDTVEAKKYLRDAIALTTNKDAQIPIYFNLTRVFIRENQTDSAAFYLNKSMDMVDLNENNKHTLNIYSLLSDIEANNNNYKGALDYVNKHIDILHHIYKNNEEQRVHEIEKRYGFEQILNKHNQLLIQRQWILVAILALVLLFLIFGFYYSRRMAKKKKELQEIKELNAQLQEIANNYEHEKNIFKKTVFERFNIITKAKIMQGLLRKEELKQNEKFFKKIDEIVYGQETFNWEVVYQMANEHYDKFYDKLCRKYPSLDESEIKICCLTYADLNNTEISIIMNQSINTVQMKRSSVRKKMGIKEYGNLVEFWKQNI